MIAETVREGKLFRLAIPGPESMAMAARTAQAEDVTVWHRRLAHMGEADVKKMENLTEGVKIKKGTSVGVCGSCMQYWQTSGPKFGPTRYPADRSIHWAGIRLGMPSPAPNRTQFGRTDMYAKCGSGRQFFRSIGSVFACRKPKELWAEFFCPKTIILVRCRMRVK